jgi:hypothetical protein
MMARIVTMLACLILVPLAALFGTALPDVIREKLAGPAPRAAARSQPDAVAFTKSPDSPNSPRPQAHPSTKPDTAAPPTAATPHHAAPPKTPSADASQNDRLLVLLQRLQQLGALHYRLERSPQSGGQYWFHCDVNGSPEPFVATDSDPIRTTERVVLQVEAWQASRIR